MLFYTVPFSLLDEDGDDFGKTEVYDIHLAIDYRYAPERPAPYCSNPSSPAFYDTGDPEEIEVNSVQVDCIRNSENERQQWPAAMTEWIAKQYARLMNDDPRFREEIENLIRVDAKLEAEAFAAAAAGY